MHQDQDLISINPGSSNQNKCNDSSILSGIIGGSIEMRRVIDLVKKVAVSDSTVLVTGESGTGKELIAKALHALSSRSNKPFVPINCGAIPSELLESELFGHIKGAFTGAINHRTGRFEIASGGSLFLDEIGDLSLHLQVKLLRVLQDRKFEAVGSAKTQVADVRVIAATNVDLERAVTLGKFREDLFYRLNVIPIHIPALRERPYDIPLLITHFISHFNQIKNKSLSGVSNEAMECMMAYNWPGNIRELENLIERISILKGFGDIEISDLPNHYRERVRRAPAFHASVFAPSTQSSAENDATVHRDALEESYSSHHLGDRSRLTTSASGDAVHIPEDGMDFNSAVDAYENALILQALEKTGWNRNQAATLLKLNRTTLVEKIKKKGLRPKDIEM